MKIDVYRLLIQLDRPFSTSDTVVFVYISIISLKITSIRISYREIDRE